MASKNKNVDSASVKKQVASNKIDFDGLNSSSLLKALNDDHAINRIEAAKRLNILVKENPEKFKKNIKQFIKALDVMEALTRWMTIECLILLSEYDSKACIEAVQPVQKAMFEEANPQLTINAYKFLCVIGSTNVANSKIVWPYIEDAIETFDGDIDYDKFLLHTIIFAKGKIAKNIKSDLIRLVAFDAKNTPGVIGYRAKCIIAALKGKKMPTTKKKTTAKKAATKKPVAKKTTAKKAVKKAAPKKKVAAKKTTAKKAVKKATPKKRVVKKAAPKKKTAAKKTVKKATPKKKTVKKAAPKKKTTAKKAVKKATPKKKVTKKATPKKKTAAKKTVKKATPKKKVTKKATPKKKTTAKKAVKKATPKKKTAKKPAKKTRK